MTEQHLDSSWTLYLLRCADDSLYTGITTDVQRRLAEHSRTSGKSRGAKALRGRQPLTLVFQLSLPNKSVALQLEYRIKQLSRADKERLVVGHLDPMTLLPDETGSAAAS